MQNILIFPCGAENALELYDSLRFSPHFLVYGASGVKNTGTGIYPPERLCSDLPFIGSPDFIPELNRLIDRFNIDMVFSTHDDVLLKLVSERSALNAHIIGPDRETAEFCRNKAMLYSHFAGCDFLPEWTLGQPDFPPPYFVKPVSGQGGQGCHKTDLVDESCTGKIISEYLPGREYTVDCFTDQHGKLLFMGPRSRDTIKMGIAFESAPVELTPEIGRIAKALNDSLSFRGLWFFQIKENANGELKLLEISGRIATTMGVYRQLGVNLPLMTAYDACGIEVSPLAQAFPISFGRRLRNICSLDIAYGAIYVDYDDTLVCHGKVNSTLIAFLYQSLNDGKQLILLTRHEGNLAAHMKSMRISKDLFDEIIHLPPDADKTEYIKHVDSIYIDNMFHDRLAVSSQLGIPVFDADAIPALLKG